MCSTTVGSKALLPRWASRLVASRMHTCCVLVLLTSDPGAVAFAQIKAEPRNSDRVDAIRDQWNDRIESIKSYLIKATIDHAVMGSKSKQAAPSPFSETRLESNQVFKKVVEYAIEGKKVQMSWEGEQIDAMAPELIRYQRYWRTYNGPENRFLNVETKMIPMGSVSDDTEPSRDLFVHVYFMAFRFWHDPEQLLAGC